tara:strand:- start:4428 stop:4679 length:252 start_codon:yes stop_codon:yes gene_type:complete
MKFKAEIDVMPLKELLDPQGKAVGIGLSNIGLNAINNVRIGKHISVEIDANDKAEAESKIKNACDKLLANPVMEYYTFSINPA